MDGGGGVGLGGGGGGGVGLGGRKIRTKEIEHITSHHTASFRPSQLYNILSKPESTVS